MYISEIKSCSLFSGEEYNDPIATQDFSLDIATMFLGNPELEEILFSRIRFRGISDGCQHTVLQLLVMRPNEVVSHLPSGCYMILCNSSRPPRRLGLIPVFLEDTTRDVPDSIGNQSGTFPTARKTDSPPFWRRSCIQSFVQFFIQFLASFLSMWLFEFINH